MKCKDCSACKLVIKTRWDARINSFVSYQVQECWGVPESFIITDINKECPAYPEKRNKQTENKNKMKKSKLKIFLDPGAKMPTRAHPTDAGLDLYSRESKTIYAERADKGFGSSGKF